MLNAKGGILGKKIEIITEDNRSEPQEAVVGYRKMMSSDNVQIFASGCVSAGNFAAAASVVRAKIPMVLCSILPRQPEEQKWAFSTLAPPKFEVEVRYQYLKDKTQIRKVGLLHDPTPYAMLTKDIAPEDRRRISGSRWWRPRPTSRTTPTSSVQIGRINAAGAGAIIKMGQGGSTVTAAKNIKQLALDKLILMASIDNVRGVPRRGRKSRRSLPVRGAAGAIARGAHRSGHEGGGRGVPQGLDREARRCRPLCGGPRL